MQAQDEPHGRPGDGLEGARQDACKATCGRCVGGGAETVEAQLAAQILGRQRQGSIERDPRGVGDSDHALEVADHRSRIYQPCGADSLQDRGTRAGQLDIVLTEHCLGEGHERSGVRHAAAGRRLAIGHDVQVDLVSVQLAARTEQQGVRRGSVEALVQCGHPAGNELHLHTAERTPRAQVQKLLQRQILRCG